MIEAKTLAIHAIFSTPEAIEELDPLHPTLKQRILYLFYNRPEIELAAQQFALTRIIHRQCRPEQVNAYCAGTVANRTES